MAFAGEEELHQIVFSNEKKSVKNEKILGTYVAINDQFSNTGLSQNIVL